MNGARDAARSAARHAEPVNGKAVEGGAPSRRAAAIELQVIAAIGSLLIIGPDQVE